MATTNTVSYDADISQLESAARQFINLMGSQGQAVQNLMIKQLEFNANTKRATATVEANLSASEKLILTLRKKQGAWDATKGKVVENTVAMRAQQKALDDYLKSQEKLNQRAQQRAARAAEIDAGGSGRSSILSPADFARIAEATLFKTALTQVTNALSDAITRAKDFQIQISLIRTVSQENNLSMEQWATGLKDVANLLGIDVVDAAKAAYDAIQSQVVFGAQTLVFLKDAGDLARTTNTNIQQAGDVLASVIQSFNLSITESRETAAILFKAVELGRIELGELTTALGKVGPAAHAMGISLVEVAAAEATLTRQGVRTNDATTLVTNVILKLVKPTEGMTKLLQSWGFASSQAAIETLGFVGVLRKLEEVTDGRISELADYFNELRGLKGAVGLTSAFKDFEADVAKLQNSRETFEKAVEIRAESSGDKIRRFNEVVKNSFTEAYGQIAITIQEQFIPALGNTENATKFVTNAILGTVVVAGTLKTVMYANSVLYTAFAAAEARVAAATLAATAAQDAYNKTLILGGTVAQANTAKMNSLAASQAANATAISASKTAMTNAIGTMVLLTAAVTALKIAYDAVSASATNAAQASDGNLKRIYENLKNVDSKKVEDTAKKNLQDFTERSKNLFRIPLEAAAGAYRAADSQLDALKAKSSSLAEQFGISYKSYLDVLKESVRKLNSEISRSQTLIKQSKEAVASFAETLDDIIRRTQFKYATDEQKPQLLQNQIDKALIEARRNFAKGDEQSISRARSQYDEVARLVEEQFNAQIDLEKKAAENLSKATGQPVTLTVSTLQLQQKLNALLQERNGLEDKYQKQLEKTIAKKKQEEIDQVKKNREIENAVKNFTDFDLYKNGKVDDKFLGKDGKLDKAKVEADVQAQIDAITKLIPFEKQSYEFYRDLYAQKRNLAAQVEAQITRDVAEAEQNRLGKIQQIFVDKFKKAQDTIAKLSQDAFAPQGQSDLLKADAKSLFDFTETSLGFGNKYLNLNNLKSTIESQQAAAAAKKALEDYYSAQDLIKKNARNVEGQIIPRAEDVEIAEKKLGELELAVRRYFATVNKGIDDSNFRTVRSNVGDGKEIVFGDVIDDIRKNLDLLKGAGKSADEEAARLKTLGEDLSKILGQGVVPLVQQFPQLAAIGNDANGVLQKGMAGFKSEVDQAIQSVIRLREEMLRLPPPPAGGVVQPNGDNGDDAEYFATGGYIHPGKPRGSDTIPAWLTPGEFVVNAAATRKFYSQLIDINRGKSPRYMAGGGYVTTNVGDVHVHVSSGDARDSSNLARTIGRQLRREIKRGTARIN